LRWGGDLITGFGFFSVGEEKVTVWVAGKARVLAFQYLKVSSPGIFRKIKLSASSCWNS